MCECEAHSRALVLCAHEKAGTQRETRDELWEESVYGMFVSPKVVSPFSGREPGQSVF